MTFLSVPLTEMCSRFTLSICVVQTYAMTVFHYDHDFFHYDPSVPVIIKKVMAQVCTAQIARVKREHISVNGTDRNVMG